MACMRSTAFVLLFCLGLLTAACDDKPTKPGMPVPKASSANLVAPVSSSHWADALLEVGGRATGFSACLAFSYRGVSSPRR